MPGLSVNPGKMEELAVKLDAAHEIAGEATGVTSSVENDCWVTHGVISGVSNGAFGLVAQARQAAVGNLAVRINDLAAKVRTAAATYSGVDRDLSGNLDNQMSSR